MPLVLLQQTLSHARVTGTSQISMAEGDGTTCELLSEESMEALTCDFCQGFRAPMRVSCPEGHMHCLDCLTKYVNDHDGEHCPKCRTELLPILASDGKPGLPAPATNELINSRNCKCPHCNTTIRACEVREHFGVCPKVLVDCPFSGMGCCQKKMPREELNNHLRDAVGAHSMLQTVAKLREDVGEVKQCLEGIREWQEEERAKQLVREACRDSDDAFRDSTMKACFREMKQALQKQSDLLSKLVNDGKNRDKKRTANGAGLPHHYKPRSASCDEQEPPNGKGRGVVDDNEDEAMPMHRVRDASESRPGTTNSHKHFSELEMALWIDKQSSSGIVTLRALFEEFRSRAPRTPKAKDKLLHLVESIVDVEHASDLHPEWVRGLLVVTLKPDTYHKYIFSPPSPGYSPPSPGYPPTTPSYSP